METTQAARSREGRFNISAGIRVWNAKRRRRVGAREHHILGNYASSKARRMISTPPLIHFMKNVVPLLLALVLLKYQGQPQVIFRENPVPVWRFLVAISVYWLIVGLMKQMPTLSRKWFQTLRYAAVISAILSSISLLSILLPDPFPLVPPTMLISLPVALALLYVCSLVLRGIESAINKIHRILISARGCNLTEEASSPV